MLERIKNLSEEREALSHVITDINGKLRAELDAVVALPDVSSARIENGNLAIFTNKIVANNGIVIGKLKLALNLDENVPNVYIKNMTRCVTYLGNTYSVPWAITSTRRSALNWDKMTLAVTHWRAKCQFAQIISAALTLLRTPPSVVQSAFLDLWRQEITPENSSFARLSGDTTPVTESSPAEVTT